MRHVKLTEDVEGYGPKGTVVLLDDETADAYVDAGTATSADAPERGDGDSHHDELANTDADHHGAVTEAPVVDGVPQAPQIEGTAPDADEAATNQGDEPFDPTDHNVDDVNAYLANADDAERDRVLALERDGKARVGIVGNSDAG